ncbi:MAG: DUF1858 domain-containing protein [Oscillospiraceae bacterium]|nr:DUF1858 domain-containing protein [Oscillospiraceae bacterium]
MDFPYDVNSRLSDILDAYPWLADILPEYDARLKALSNPAVRAMTRKYTVADVSRFTGYSTDKLLDKLRRLAQEHA